MAAAKKPVSWPRRIRIRVPATTSNLGPGFDVLGMALKLYCETEVRVGYPDLRRRAWNWSAGLPAAEAFSVHVSGEGSESLPQDARNLVVKSFRSMLRGARLKVPLEFHVRNGIPLERGLGSSAAARLCGLLAAGALYGFRKEFGQERLVERATAMEGHPDNVIPAFHGGLRACLQEDGRVMHFGLRWPSDLGVVVCVPDFTVATRKARRALPAKIAFRDAVHTSSRLALLISALEQGEYAWLKTAMRDVLHQPHRRKLVRGMDAVIREAVDAGAFGASLSGSGPAIIAIALRGAKQAKIGRAMQKAFFRHGAESRYFVLDAEPKGARIETR